MKGMVSKLKKKVKTLKSKFSKKITQEVFNHLESKLENVIAANNLKKNASRKNAWWPLSCVNNSTPYPHVICHMICPIICPKRVIVIAQE